MRVTVVFLALVALGASVPQPVKQQAADQTFLKKQHQIILLLENILGEIPNDNLANIGHTYDIKANLQAYKNPNLVKYLITAVETGNVQPKGTIFCTLVSQLRQEAVLLTRILLGAKDWQTFLNTAAWARVNLNEGQFVAALAASILQRQDTQGIIIPPLYEILPQGFFDARVIQQVQNIKTAGVKNVAGQQIFFPINQTSHLPSGEHKIAYFTEDIGLNAYYSYLHLVGVLILEQEELTSGTQQSSGSQQQIGHGAQWIYLQQQLLAHYNLERLGNGLGPIPNLDWKHVNIPFKSHLSYVNGLELAGRSEGPLDLTAIRPQLANLVRILEKRVIDAIDCGHVITPSGALLSLYQPQGINILGNLIEGFGRSINPRYYGNLMQASKFLLGGTPQYDNIWEFTPAALELSYVATRDPALYVLLKQIIKLIQKYQESLPAYQYNDIVLPGVQIQTVQVSPLVTYFQDWIVNLDNAVMESVSETYQKQQQQQQQGGLKTKGLLKRLDHLPYNMEIVVQCQQPISNAVVRVFLGPKIDHENLPIDISANRMDFVELDQWVVDLTAGQNVITRNSQQSSIQGMDMPSVDQIKQLVEGAIQSQNPLFITQPQQLFGFPARLSLPKGKYGGFPLQLFVVISAGQQPLHYGPVIPDAVNSFHSHQWQAVTQEQYEQIIEQPSTAEGHVMVDVVPDLEELGVGVNKGKWKWTNLYNKYIGYFSQPQWQHMRNLQGVGQTMGGQGIGNLVKGQVIGGQGVLEGQGTLGQGILTGQGTVGQGILTGQGTGGQPITGTGWGVLSGGMKQHLGGGVTAGISASGWSGIMGQSWSGGVKGVSGIGTGMGTGAGAQGQKSAAIVQQYYNNLPISQVIGGAISLDGKPLGWPLDRPIAPSAWSVPNIHVQDVVIHHQDVPLTPIAGVQ